MDSKGGHLDYPARRAFCRVIICGMVLFMTSVLVMTFHDHVWSCQKRNWPPNLFGLGANNSEPHCTAVYEKCFCSVSRNVSKEWTDCITEFSVVGIEILIMISTVAQLYVLYELFWNLRYRRFIIAGIFWVTCALIFTPIGIKIHTTACPFFLITRINEFLVTTMSLLILGLLVIQSKRERERSCRSSWRYRRWHLVKKHDRKRLVEFFFNSTSHSHRPSPSSQFFIVYRFAVVWLLIWNGIVCYIDCTYKLSIVTMKKLVILAWYVHFHMFRLLAVLVRRVFILFIDK